ncbi:MAG TPA: nucleoside hydrolase [Herpetosiphonaceae bacterium]
MLTDARRLDRLEPPRGLPAGPVRMVLDTDAANEIDDQFAIAYALLAPERLRCEAVYAAPYAGRGADTPAQGMRNSYEEIERVLDRLGRPAAGFAFAGAEAWLTDSGAPRPSPAADDLIRRALAGGDEPLYVVAIGAITNVASALLLAPEIAERIVVVWLGGNPQGWHPGAEYNVRQDMRAARMIFDGAAPLVHVPCRNVTEHLRTTQAELERFVAGRSRIGDYLFEIFSAYRADHAARSKVIWDIGPVAWLINPGWIETVIAHSPLLGDDGSWAYDPRRPLMREARSLRRDPIFGDLFARLAAADGGAR